MLGCSMARSAASIVEAIVGIGVGVAEGAAEVVRKAPKVRGKGCEEAVIEPLEATEVGVAEVPFRNTSIGRILAFRSSTLSFSVTAT